MMDVDIELNEIRIHWGPGVSGGVPMGSQGGFPWGPRVGCPWDPKVGAHGIPGWVLGDPLDLRDRWALGDLGRWGPIGPWGSIGPWGPRRLRTRALGAQAHGPRDKVL